MMGGSAGEEFFKKKTTFCYKKKTEKPRLNFHQIKSDALNLAFLHPRDGKLPIYTLERFKPHFRAKK